MIIWSTLLGRKNTLSPSGPFLTYKGTILWIFTICYIQNCCEVQMIIIVMKKVFMLYYKS